MKVLPFMFFLLFCSVCSNAQDKRSIGWLNVGGGFAGSKNLTGMGLYSSLNAEFPIFKKPGSILQTDKFHKRYTSVGFRYSCLWGSGDEHYGGELRYAIFNGLGMNNDYKLVFLMGCEVTSGKIPMNISVDFKITPLTRVCAGLSLRYPIKHPDVQS